MWMLRARTLLWVRQSRLPFKMFQFSTLCIFQQPVTFQESSRPRWRRSVAIQAGMQTQSSRCRARHHKPTDAGSGGVLSTCISGFWYCIHQEDVAICGIGIQELHKVLDSIRFAVRLHVSMGVCKLLAPIPTIVSTGLSWLSWTDLHALSLYPCPANRIRKVGGKGV